MAIGRVDQVFSGRFLDQTRSDSGEVDRLGLERRRRWQTSGRVEHDNEVTQIHCQTSQNEYGQQDQMDPIGEDQQSSKANSGNHGKDCSSDHQFEWN